MTVITKIWICCKKSGQSAYLHSEFYRRNDQNDVRVELFMFQTDRGFEDYKKIWKMIMIARKGDQNIENWF